MHPVRDVVQDHDCISPLHVFSYRGHFCSFFWSFFPVFNSSAHEITAPSIWTLTLCIYRLRANIEVNFTNPSGVSTVGNDWWLPRRLWNLIFIVSLSRLQVVLIIVPILEDLWYVCHSWLDLRPQISSRSDIRLFEGRLNHLCRIFPLLLFLWWWNHLNTLDI